MKDREQNIFRFSFLYFIVVERNVIQPSQIRRELTFTRISFKVAIFNCVLVMEWKLCTNFYYTT